MTVNVHFSPLYKLSTYYRILILELSTKFVHYFFNWYYWWFDSYWSKFEFVASYYWQFSSLKWFKQIWGLKWGILLPCFFTHFLIYYFSESEIYSSLNHLKNILCSERFVLFAVKKNFNKHTPHTSFTLCLICSIQNVAYSGKLVVSEWS